LAFPLFCPPPNFWAGYATGLQCFVLRAVLSVFIGLRSVECVCSYLGLRVCSQTNNFKLKATLIYSVSHLNFGLKLCLRGKAHKVCNGTEFWVPCVARQ